MALNATINIVVNDLPENDIWFANAQAWKNYWANVTGYIEVTGASVLAYSGANFVPANYPIVALNIDGTTYQIPTTQTIEYFAAEFNALQNSYVALRTALKDAGLISITS